MATLSGIAMMRSALGAHAVAAPKASALLLVRPMPTISHSSARRMTMDVGARVIGDAHDGRDGHVSKGGRRVVMMTVALVVVVMMGVVRLVVNDGPRCGRGDGRELAGRHETVQHSLGLLTRLLLWTGQFSGIRVLPFSGTPMSSRCLPRLGRLWRVVGACGQSTVAVSHMRQQHLLGACCASWVYRATIRSRQHPPLPSSPDRRVRSALLPLQLRFGSPRRTDSPFDTSAVRDSLLNVPPSPSRIGAPVLLMAMQAADVVRNEIGNFRGDMNVVPVIVTISGSTDVVRPCMSASRCRLSVER
jgi:hypothetical protein